ncbi:hypothetical protein DDE82_007290 [Stemphylium lycopersici]|uniref:Uncharacterized protein n=1 Tax=Stemphylium lycopersici TaxID=183478 RepID=A0A364MRZ4_STELY|nr:hypothetical protein TW65_07274 [Stemphylium lycopersici]RAR00455.1 hypothetical protein DDE82_007290 [Stemphylium lycopersici]RAR00581.1 hypothetical protein DDE83_009085 [Stemphylium lycopersici]
MSEAGRRGPIGLGAFDAFATDFWAFANCMRALPNFLPPSNPELATLLSTFNSKVLLPSHLTKEQEKLVYSQESRAKLEAEPVEITLGDVTLPLEHLDRNVLPDRFHTLRAIVKDSKTAEDWENVVRCLQGFEEAGIPVKGQWQEMVVRKLNLAGMQHLVLKALQRPTATGLRLSNWGLLSQVLRTVHDKAALAGWEEEETTKALRMAKQVVELMESEEHCGRTFANPKPNQGDWRGHPVVIALPTEMAAVLAEKYGGDKEEVKKMANRLVTAIKQRDYMASLDAIAAKSTPALTDHQSRTGQRRYVMKHYLELLELIILENALKTSRSVLGSDMPLAQESQKYEARVEEVVKNGLASMKDLAVRDGREIKSGFADYVKEMAEKSK